uniref:Uncharacterized protein n=1 Tax=Physcomitrium patens TaxID=3218 RepID=A0A2K1KH82_PHYPA|nr:hypothetical protein PHYPA_009494 [Physcomitrium patens]
MAKSIMSPLSQVWPDREHGWGCRTVIFGHLVPQISFIE